jgi:hypothetical protein
LACRALRRVLVPDGRLVLAMRMRHADVGRFDPSRHGLSGEDVETIVGTLVSLGYREVTTKTQAGLDRRTVTAIVGRC